MKPDIQTLIQQITDQEGPGCPFTRAAEELLTSTDVTADDITFVKTCLGKLGYLNQLVDGERKAYTWH